MKFFRDNWFYVGTALFVVLAIAFPFVNDLFSQVEIILYASFMSLLLHQFEEYIFPAGGPVIINKVVWKEEENYRRYQGNTQSIMIVNVSAWVLYLVAFFNPQLIWLGLGTMFFNLFQFVGHGIQMNKALKTWYNPGLASVLFLFIPIGIYYMLFVTENQLATTWDWIFGVITFILAFVVTTVLPVQLLKDKNSPYEIPEWQVEKFNKVMKWASISKK